MNSWEIREYRLDDYDVDYDRMPDDYGRERYGREMGMRGDEAEQAYKEGCRHGYEKAMRKVKEMLHGSIDERTEYGDRSGESYGRTGERRPMGMPEPGEMGERRRRSNGRFY